MRKWKKRIQRRNQAKHAFLAATVMAALFCTTPAQAAPILNDGTPDRTNMINTDLTIGSGETVTTWSRTTERPTAVRYNGNILINSGGIWRPMDAKAINVYGSFELDSGALLDLSYKYGENYPDNPWATYENTNLAYSRNFLTYGTTILHDGSIIRLNVGGGTGTDNLSDKLVFNNLQLAADETAATVRLQIRYNKNTGGLGEKNSTANFWDFASASLYSGTINRVITINNITEAVDNNLDFSAETYYKDSSLNKYLFVPTLTSAESTYEGVTTKSYNLDWTATRTDLVSQGVFSAANAQLSMRNLWRMEDGLFWKRGEELRAANRLGQNEGADGAWAQIWRGDYSYDGAYGSSFGQSYNGIQVGYDKQREGNLFGGKVYTGLFLSMLNSNADFHQHTLSSGSDEALYSSSAGDLKSGGIGLYTSWIGDKGHYLDLTVRGSKLSNQYKFCDSDDNLYDNDYGTWTYGAGLRYGYQKQLTNDWFVEPQVGLSYGKMKGYSYMQDNNMRYTQEEMDMLIGRLGVTAGRNFTSGDKRGTVYAKAAVNHDFMDGGKARADAMYWGSYYNKNGTKVEGYQVAASLPVDTLASKDTWYEFALGANLQTGKDQNAFVELTKTAGGKVNTDWQVNAGMSWRFNGPSSAGVQTDAIDRSMKALEFSPAAKTDAKQLATTGGTDLAAGKATPEAQPAQTAKTEQDSQAIAASSAVGTDKAVAGDSLKTSVIHVAQREDTAPVSLAEQANKTGKTTQEKQTAPTDTGERATAVPETAPFIADDNEPGSFTMAPLVVEAQRPDWEKKLSPGTVSVIHVPEYKGEMKNLPDLLQTVPGVYVQRLQGTGHYTVAKVRGSTGGQVNIYVDGVLVNSASEAAVDLSTIPIENVDHSKYTAATCRPASPVHLWAAPSTSSLRNRRTPRAASPPACAPLTAIRATSN
ncbi:autotransporter outer membrane beta-barrel domain-containing protein [Pelosinus propionicus]|uniref:Outer membrane autotransporter barrel domain-containing protein n=1 Tax=Pelosinus propionicus DSM 13327 TaxID=1123291 RepID=A0A1I4MBN5_9FIRM|nr:autotransporter outer membrane beta-barrel domain-containing protein [Pelosinus propionicus]SFM00671.1 outer membrane autotransporter barrel domain-containing protein [Pelosinus propionicus DSM 13327]